MMLRLVPHVISFILMIPFPLFAVGSVVESPNAIAPDRYVYYPGTQVLAEDEIRVIACGTGWTAGRPVPLEIWCPSGATEDMGTAWAVEGTLRQPPPEPGLANPMTDFIRNGEWGPAFNAQNKMPLSTT
ncbi:MAG: hypothetical protein ACR2QU_03365 [Gammaproteobacteria bacterium]